MKTQVSNLKQEKKSMLTEIDGLQKEIEELGRENK
jgi:hypothetical protein